LFQSITAPSVRKCPKCGKLKVKRLIGTGAGIIFKGSGFYQTDYRTDSYKQGAQKDKPATAPSDKSATSTAAASSTKSDAPAKSTPAAKSDSSAKAAG
jgi:predicted nucleic acid-binding Zn ribbon protein